GGSGRGRPRHLLDRALGLRRRSSRHVGRCRGRRDPGGRLDPDPVLRLARGRPGPPHDALRGAPTGPGRALPPLRNREPRLGIGARAVLRRGPALPGEPAVAGVGRARRHAGDRAHRVGRTCGGRRRQPRDRPPRDAGRVRRSGVRARRDHDLPRTRRRAVAIRRGRRVPLRVRGARVRRVARAARVAAWLAGARGADAFDATTEEWRVRLGSVSPRLPPRAREHAQAVRTAAAHVLVNRDGPALQPGPRRYTRAWIRDGAIMAAALLRAGQSAAACEFVRWYATHQRADGNVPCAVDHNGPDWLPEHDSHGELVFAVIECFRFTRDRAFLAEMWPAVQRAIAYQETLRATRLGPEFDAPALRARRGLLPESVSHEGY